MKTANLFGKTHVELWLQDLFQRSPVVCPCKRWMIQYSIYIKVLLIVCSNAITKIIIILCYDTHTRSGTVILLLDVTITMHANICKRNSSSPYLKHSARSLCYI
jgi:hypothetical protein